MAWIVAMLDVCGIMSSSNASGSDPPVVEVSIGFTHKHSKARKFSYRYKGPFEIEGKIYLLIYKVRLADGTSVILHINRLKRAYERAGNDNTLPLNGSSDKAVQSRRTKKLALKEREETGTEKLGVVNPSRSQILDVEGE